MPVPHFRTIEVDFDVHRCIEIERRGFDESPNDALRRLLKLGEPKPAPTKASSSSPASRKSWSDQSVTLPHGTSVRMRYNRRTYEGQIADGSWVIGDRKFDSPSGAASGVAVTKKGKSTRLDGWIYWQVRMPGEDSWKSLESLRPTITLEQLGYATGGDTEMTPTIPPTAQSPQADYAPMPTSRRARAGHAVYDTT